MKKLKILLQSKYLLLFLFIISLCYVILFTKIKKYHSVYNDGNTTLIGKILSIIIKEDKVTLIIEEKEKIQASLFLKEPLQEQFLIGQTIEVQGELKTPNKNTIPNNFNYQEYLTNQKIYKILTIEDYHIIRNKINFLAKIKNFFYQRCRTNKYLSLFIVGDKSLLEEEIYSSFKNIGVAHLLAISGMHISVFILILKKLLFFLRRKTVFIITSIVLLVYAYIINFSPSILRVTLYYILSNLFKNKEIKISNINTLGCVAFIIILFNPFVIYYVSFQYSFCTSLSIMLSKNYFSKNYFLNILIITFFTLLASLPITINLNYEINLITFLGNLILIPFVSYIIYPIALLAFIFKPILFILNLVTMIMEIIIINISKVNLLVITIPKLPGLIILIYYLLLYCFYYFKHKRYLLMLGILVLVFKYSYLFDYSYHLYIFDVKQGDSSLIISPHYHDVILIDTGGIISYNTSNKYHISDNVITFLKSKGITKINSLIISHGDYDHMGDAINIVNKLKVNKVIFNCGEYNDLEQNLIKILNKKQINYAKGLNELNITNTKLHFLNTKLYDNENDNSNVIYFNYQGLKFLFMGDAGVETEKAILAKYDLKDIDFLKVGHHGSDTSSSQEFINRINPKYALISVGKNNRYGHPKESVLDTLKEAKIYRTDDDGSIEIKINDGKYKIRTYSP